MNFKHTLTYMGLSVLILMPSFSISAKPTTYIEKTCPNNNPFHLIVNKQQSVDANFVPSDLVIPNINFSFSGYHEKKNLDRTAAEALEDLFEAAKNEKVHLYGVSGYRSYTRQSQLYSSYVKRDGQAKADTYSARPGTSEHQTGLSIDVSAASVGYNLTTNFGTTQEGKWLQENAHRFGFIIRYPKGKESITGYMYEPWHIRYVGPTLAETVYTTGLTLEELDTCCEEITPALPTIEPASMPFSWHLLRHIGTLIIGI